MSLKDNNNAQILWKLMQALNGDQIESAISDAFEVLLECVGAANGTVWIKNKETERIYSMVSVGETNISGFSIEIGQGIVGQACDSEEPIDVPDAASDERFPGGKDEITGIEVKNVYFMPMHFRKETVGCVELINRSVSGEFTEDEISLIHSFAGLITLFIDENGYSYSTDTDKKVIMSLKGITKDYKSGMDMVHILKGVDLDIYENELLVILGESGCGKSTLLNIIGGMDSPTSGEITLDDKDFSHPTEKELVNFRRDYIGFIFQAYNLMPNLTALENVKFIAEICKNPGDPAEAIELVGLTSRANNYPSMMSGGQQQRVSIARAIVKRPRIILADEPTAALDFTTGQEVLELIEDLISKKMTTVVMVTHNVEIAKMANRVIRVKNGKISSIRVNTWPMHAADLVW
ncbi:MAG: ATP-binding cassette domain-containing protein [Butyrivibrio sp.]|nr:ATP-binding cassette domain-containing protein [Butyrivibrio sp.]